MFAPRLEMRSRRRLLHALVCQQRLRSQAALKPGPVVRRIHIVAADVPLARLAGSLIEDVTGTSPPVFGMDPRSVPHGDGGLRRAGRQHVEIPYPLPTVSQTDMPSEVSKVCAPNQPRPHRRRLAREPLGDDGRSPRSIICTGNENRGRHRCSVRISRRRDEKSRIDRRGRRWPASSSARTGSARSEPDSACCLGCAWRWASNPSFVR